MLLAFGIASAMLLAETATAVYRRTLSPKTGLTLQYSPSTHLTDDPVLGYAAIPGARVSALRKRFDTTLYDVVYTISDRGVRVTPGNPAGETWLFMGCSFTFGEGVNDDETLPAQFSEKLGRQANVVNLGLNGYGPHHMLRMLETGRLAGAAAPVKHVIYQALSSHAARSAGRATWGLTSPSYIVSGDTVRYTGPFYGSRGLRTIEIVRKSALGRFLLERYYYDAPLTADDIDLYARIVERAAVLAEKNLGARFSILFWDDDDDGTTKRIFDRLEATGLPVIRATSLVPRHDLDSLRIPYDRHPMPEAYRRLAAGLASRFGESPPE